MTDTCKHLHLEKIANMSLNPSDLAYRCEGCHTIFKVTLSPFRLVAIEAPATEPQSPVEADGANPHAG